MKRPLASIPSLYPTPPPPPPPAVRPGVIRGRVRGARKMRKAERGKGGKGGEDGMKGFVFNLQPLLEFRERVKEISRKEFSEALRRLEEEEGRLLALKDVYTRTSREIDAMREEWARTPREAGDIGLYSAYITRLKNHIEGEEDILASARVVLERRRAAREAAREKKAVENEERKADDGMVSTRFRRRRRA